MEEFTKDTGLTKEEALKKLKEFAKELKKIQKKNMKTEGIITESRKSVKLDNFFMTHNYGEIIPDEIIDTFYKQIKRCIDENCSYEHYIRNLIKLNSKLPDKIKKLIS